MKRKEHPFLAGLHAARANFLPGLVIQCGMLALLLGYYYWPPLHAPLSTVAGWKAHYGYLFTFLIYGCAGGLLPELLRVLVLQKGRLTAENRLDAWFGFLFWGFMGICGDTLYRFLGHLLGDQPSVTVVLTKLVLDLFIYTPLWGTAAVVSAYHWRRHGFATAALLECFSFTFYRTHIIPSLVTGWAVWIPLVSIVYSLPQLLQVPFAALATSFWSLLVTFMRRQATAASPTPILTEEEL